MTNEFKIGNEEFKIRKLDAMRQFHVVRRLAPTLQKLVPALSQISQEKVESGTEAEKLDSLAKFLAPVVDGISSLSDQDAEFVLKNLLSSVECHVNGGWGKISDGNIFLQEKDLSILLQCAARAFMFNLSGFFEGLKRS